MSNVNFNKIVCFCFIKNFPATEGSLGDNEKPEVDNGKPEDDNEKPEGDIGKPEGDIEIDMIEPAYGKPEDDKIESALFQFNIKLSEDGISFRGFTKTQEKETQNNEFPSYMNN